MSHQGIVTQSRDPAVWEDNLLQDLLFFKKKERKKTTELRTNCDWCSKSVLAVFPCTSLPYILDLVAEIFVTTHPRGPRWLVLAIRIRLAAPVLAPLYLFLPNIFSRSISMLTILADYIGSRWLASMQLSAR